MEIFLLVSLMILIVVDIIQTTGLVNRIDSIESLVYGHSNNLKRNNNTLNALENILNLKRTYVPAHEDYSIDLPTPVSNKKKGKK